MEVPLRKRSIALATALVTVAALGFGAGALASSRAAADGGYTTNGYTDLGGFPEPQACHGTDPACYHDWGNFDPAKNGYHLLVYTYTNGPRHADLGPALGPGLDPPLTAANVVQNSLIAMGKANGFSVDWTEDESVFGSPATLFKYNAILFFTSRDVLDDAGQTALRVYIEGGGAFVGVHNAFGTNYNWDWFRGLLGGAQLYDHAAEQTGTVDVLDPKRRVDQGTAQDVDCRGRVVQPGARAAGRADSSPRSMTAPSRRDSRGTTATRAWARSIPSPGASTTTAARPG